MVDYNSAMTIGRVRTLGGKFRKGFTIVELLIVIVVIGILAALVVSTYAGVQDRAREAKISADMKTLAKAVAAARESKSSALRYITGAAATGGPCWGKPDGTDLAALPRTDACWTTYAWALQKISEASGSNVTNLVDPWGRPYYMDENEDEPVGSCRDDWFGVYAYPFTTGQTMRKLVSSRLC